MKNTIFRKTISFIATFAVLINSLGAPLTVIAQEITSSPTPTETSSPTPEATITPTDTASPTATPDATPAETASPTPEITPTPNDIVTPASTDTPVVTQAPESNPTVQGPPSDQPTSSPTATPTFTSVQPEKEGSLTAQVLETDLFSGTLQENPWFKLVTDKLDYAPTEAAVITGTGFTAGTTYNLTASSNDEPATSTTFDITADLNGSFTYVYQLDGTYRPNYKVEVKSGEVVVALTFFTDTDKITICHANDSQSNPYVTNQPDKTADAGGHDGHNGVIWYPGIADHTWGDIIPSFTYPGGSYPGKNWTTAGQAILNNGCNITGTITIVKNVTGADGTFNFTSTGGNGLPSSFSIATSGNTGSVTYPNLITGSNGDYTITETSPSGYSLTSLNCSAGDHSTSVSTSLSNRKATINNLQNGDTVTCTYTNTQQNGTITVNKILVPSNDTGKFNLQIDGSTAGTGSNIGNNGTTGAIGKSSTGTHTIREIAGTSTSLSNYSTSYNCLDGTSSVASGITTTSTAFSVPAGHNIICTFTNTRILGTITVHKDLVGTNIGDGYSNFCFTLSPNPGNGQICADPSTGNAVFTDVPKGNYTASETQSLSAYTVTGNTCSSSMSIVNNGDTASCTITNTRNTGTIELKKVWSGTPGQTTLNIGTSPEGTSVASVTTGVAGADPLTTGIKTVNTGAYYLSELGGLTGYSSALTCTNNGQAFTPGVGNSFTVVKDHAYVCTFTNTLQSAYLTLVKTITNDNGGSALNTAWTLSASGPTPISGITGAGSVTGAAVNSGTYTLSESVGPSGYTPSTYSCVNNGGQAVVSNSITLAAGDNATCTINNNDQQAYIVVDKTVVNDNGGNAIPDQFLLTIDGSPVLDGVAFPVNPGVHVAGETLFTGYTAGAWGGDCNTNASVTVALGQTKTCTITNNDIAPKLHLRKVVINNDGGNATVNNFTLTANGTDTNDLSGTSPVDSTNALKADTFTLSETSLPGYTASAWVCVGGKQTDSNIKVDAGGEATCTITNDDIAPILNYVKLVTNNYGGTLGATSFPLFINGNSVVSGTPNTLLANFLYTLTETQQFGYTGGYFTGDCVANGTIALSVGDNKTCYITNTDVQPKLTVTKIVINDNGGTKVVTDFPLFVNTTSVKSGVQNGFNVGNYTVSENGNAGYAETISGDCNPETGNVTLGVGDVKSCTITNNDQQGTLTIVKNTVGGNGTFDFTVNGPTTGSPEVLTSQGTGQTSNIVVNAGTYSVAETPQTGWDLTGANCGLDISQNSFSIANGQNVTCTFTNTKKGHLIVQKTTTPALDQTSFNIIATGSGTITGGGGAGTISDASDKDYEVTPGTYSVSETVPDNWNQNSNNCTQVVVAAGQTSTCQIVNTKRGNVTVTKYLDHNANGVKDEGDEVLNDWEIHLDQMSQFTGAQVNGQVTFRNLVPGTYTLSEQLLSEGWYQSNISCTGDESIDKDNSHSVSVTPGQTTSCYIGNYQNAYLTVSKNVINPDGGEVIDQTSFPFNVTGQDVFNLSNGGEKVLDLTPGVYGVSETTNEEYDFKGCTNLNSDGYITVTSGQEKSVVCTNQQRKAHITVVKRVVGTDGATNVDDTNGNFVFGVATQSATLQDNGSATFDVNPGNYDVIEENNPNYGFVSCSADYEGQSAGVPLEEFNGENVTLGSNDSVTVTCINKQLSGSITGTKWNDLNDNGKIDQIGEEQSEPKIEGVTLFIDSNGNGILDGEEVSTQTDENGNYDFSKLNPGNYRICEVVQEGWIQTYPLNELNNCHQVTVASNQTVDGKDFGNFQPDPGIVKTNDKPNAVKGDTVTYTLNVTSNTNNTELSSVSVSDFLPGGFSYVLGSTTITGATTVEPSVSGNSLTWSIDNLSIENPVTITYKVKIGDDVINGTYTNFATCKTFVGGRVSDNLEARINRILAPITGKEFDCDMVHSDVTVGNGVSYGGNLQGQVLGASTELPATGSPSELMFIALGLLGAGFFLNGYNSGKSKKHAKK